MRFIIRNCQWKPLKDNQKRNYAWWKLRAVIKWTDVLPGSFIEQLFPLLILEEYSNKTLAFYDNDTAGIPAWCVVNKCKYILDLPLQAVHLSYVSGQVQSSFCYNISTHATSNRERTYTIKNELVPLDVNEACSIFRD